MSDLEEDTHDESWYDDRCPECHADVDHYLGCSEDPNPDYEAEAEAQRAEQRAAWKKALADAAKKARNQRADRKPAPVKAGMHRKRSDPET